MIVKVSKLTLCVTLPSLELESSSCFKRKGPKTPVKIAPSGAVNTIANTAIVKTCKIKNSWYSHKPSTKLPT